MAFVRYSLEGCGDDFSYRSGRNDPEELYKPMKYINKTVYNSCKYVENKWWKLVAFMSGHSGCTFMELAQFKMRARYFDADAVMRKLLIRTGTPKHYRYYLNAEGKRLFDKYKNTTTSDDELIKAQASYAKRYNEAIAESKLYVVLKHNYEVEHTIDAL